MFASNTSAANGAATYIEDVFSTYLYTGTGASQTHTNNIDLAGKGGLVWLKCRSGVENHYLQDSSSSFANSLSSNTTAASIVGSGVVTSVSSTGFTTSSVSSGTTYASWTFRKQPKFFDVVTYTGDGVTTGRQISHSLGATPGFIIVKRTDATGSWYVWHTSVNTSYGVLEGTGAFNTPGAKFVWGDGTNVIQPTSTTFTAGQSINASGGTFVAYLFAHDAGGFGLTGTDNVISCGSYTGNGSANGPEINLGYEPQWLLTKRTDLSADWQLVDTMRGMSSAYYRLFPNTTAIEDFESDGVTPTATGFKLTGVQPTQNASGGTYIYIAIRRGPMKTPTSGTSVLGLRARTGTGANATVTNGSGVTDLAIVKNRGSAVDWLWSSRLTATNYLSSNLTAAQTAAGTTILQANPWDVMNGVKVGTTSTLTNASSNTFINYLISRAPGFFDVVCYTGTGVARTVNHNLGVAPEMMIVKKRSSATTSEWVTYVSALGPTKALKLNETTVADTFSGYWNDTTPTSSVFTVGTSSNVNANASTFVAYLFASCPGVSKIGSYVGNGTNQIINCGFTAGARFILIKGIDVEPRDWYLWDSARGIVVGNDSFLNPNTSAAQTTGFDDVEADSTGFKVLQGGAQVNTSGYNYIFLAIA